MCSKELNYKPSNKISQLIYSLNLNSHYKYDSSYISYREIIIIKISCIP